MHLPGGEVAKVSPHGPAKAALPVVEVDARGVGLLIGADHIQMAVAVQVGDGNGIHSVFASEKRRGREVPRAVAELHAEAIPQSQGIVNSSAYYLECRADQIELSIAVDIHQRGRGGQDAGTEDARMRRVEASIASARIECRNGFRVKDDRIDASVTIDIAQGQSRGRFDPIALWCGAGIEIELLIFLELSAACVQKNTRAASGALIKEIGASHTQFVIQRHNIRQPVTIQVRRGKIKGVQRSGREEMEYRGTEHPPAISRKVSQFGCGEGHADDNIQISVLIKVGHGETFRDTRNVELALRSKCPVAVAEQESHGPAIGFGDDQVQFSIPVHVRNRQS